MPTQSVALVWRAECFEVREILEPARRTLVRNEGRTAEERHRQHADWMYHALRPGGVEHDAADVSQQILTVSGFVRSASQTPIAPTGAPKATSARSTGSAMYGECVRANDKKPSVHFEERGE